MALVVETVKSLPNKCYTEIAKTDYVVLMFTILSFKKLKSLLGSIVKFHCEPFVFYTNNASLQEANLLGGCFP